MNRCQVHPAAREPAGGSAARERHDRDNEHTSRLSSVTASMRSSLGTVDEHEMVA